VPDRPTPLYATLFDRLLAATGHIADPVDADEIARITFRDASEPSPDVVDARRVEHATRIAETLQMRGIARP
jgi:hypothetical protein